MPEIPRCLLARLHDVDSHGLPNEVLLNLIFDFLPVHPTLSEIHESRLNLRPVTEFDEHPIDRGILVFEPTNYEEDADFYLRMRFFEDWNDNNVELIAGFHVKKALVQKCFVKYYCDYTVYLPYRSHVPLDYPQELFAWSKVAATGVFGTVFIEGL